jgi:hypothetical protein
MGLLSLAPGWKTVDLAVNLAQAAGTYTLGTATGDCLLVGAGLYCTTVGATWTSAEITTNDTVPFVILSAAGGAVANFVAGSNLALTWSQVQKAYIQSGKLIQLAMVGATGTGAAKLQLLYVQLTSGAVIA